MRVRLAAALVLAAMVLACSAPPEKERHQAEGALAAARAAGAAAYAPDELGAAEHALGQYDEAVAARDYRQALRLALDARDGAYDAARRAADEKAIARASAERLTLEAEGLLDTIDTRIAATPAARGQAASAARWRALHESGTQALQEARSLVSGQDFRAARERLAPVVEELRKALAATPVARRP
jgi:hypothetical protein